MSDGSRRSVVWITGAGSGIGRALSLRYLRAGATVVGTARRAETLDSIPGEARGFGGRFHALPGDMTDSVRVGEIVARIEGEIGPLRLAVFNAGTHRPMPGNAFKAATIQALLDSNVMTVANAAEAALPPMLARRGGQIAIVASLAGYGGLPTAAAYGASKAALINMAEALKVDLHDSGVAVRLVCPGFIRTPLTDKNDFPMPFLMPVEAAAERLWRALEFERGFEIVFPLRLALIMKLLRLLPYAAYLPLVRRATR